MKKTWSQNVIEWIIWGQGEFPKIKLPQVSFMVEKKDSERLKEIKNKKMLDLEIELNNENKN